MISAVEFVRGAVDEVLNAPSAGMTWQIEVGENMTLEDFFDGTVVTMPAAFISYGGFMANPDLVKPSGRCDSYEDRIVIYLLHNGDMWPWATAIRNYFNTKKEGERSGNNEFKDLTDTLRRLTVQSGDGVRLPAEGIPAFEMILTV